MLVLKVGFTLAVSLEFELETPTPLLVLVLVVLLVLALLFALVDAAFETPIPVLPLVLVLFESLVCASAEPPINTALAHNPSRRECLTFEPPR